MTFSIRHVHGHAEDDPPLDALEHLYDELLNADREDVHVAVSDDVTSLTLVARRGGHLILEEAYDDCAKHMRDVSRDQVIALFRQLAEEQIDAVVEQPWLLGSPAVMSDAAPSADATRARKSMRRRR